MGEAKAREREPRRSKVWRRGGHGGGTGRVRRSTQIRADWAGTAEARRGGLRQHATEATWGEGGLGGEIVGKVGFWLSVVPWGVLLMGLTDSG